MGLSVSASQIPGQQFRRILGNAVAVARQKPWLQTCGIVAGEHEDCV
jgi:hypothetical protein